MRGWLTSTTCRKGSIRQSPLWKRVHSSTLTKEGQFLAVAVELAATGQLIGDLNLEWLSSERLALIC